MQIFWRRNNLDLGGQSLLHALANGRKTETYDYGLGGVTMGFGG